MLPAPPQVRSLQGTVTQTLQFPDAEGRPVGLDLCAHFLLTYTLLGHVKLWDLSQRCVRGGSVLSVPVTTSGF